METVSEPCVRAVQITMPAQLGFHLRVAARFVRCAGQFRSEVRVRKGKITADGKSVLGLLLLAAAWKSKLHIEAEGDDAEQAIAGIKSFFQTERRKNKQRLSPAESFKALQEQEQEKGVIP